MVMMMILVAAILLSRAFCLLPINSSVTTYPTIARESKWQFQSKSPSTVRPPVLNLPPLSRTNTSPLSDEDSMVVNVELQNTTRYEGETIRLKCEITGNLPSYTWYKNNVRVEKNNPRFNVMNTLWGSRLKIERIQKHDEGRYRCVGSNAVSEAFTEGYLNVATGPAPDRSFIDEDDFDPDSRTIDPDLDIRPIYPETPNKHLIGGGDESKKHKYDDQDSAKSSDNLGFCQAYVGSACIRYLSNQSIFVHDTNHQSMREEWVKEHISSIEKLKEISFACKQFLVPAICITAFPTCHQNDAENSRKFGVKASRTRKLCKDECELLRSVHCKEEFSEKNLLRWTSSGSNIIEKIKFDKITKVLGTINCKVLKNTVRNDACKSAGIPPVSPYDDSKCYVDDGSTYRGTVGLTKTKRPCIRWNDVGVYYEHNDFTSGFVAMEHNLCRNPDHSVPSPWCFVEAEVGHSKEACEVEVCESDQTGRYHKSLLIGIPCAILIVVIIAVVVCTRMKKEAEKKKLTDKSETQNLQQKGTVQLKSLSDRQSFQSSGTPPYIAPGNISLTYELFQQPSGKVYRGEILSFCNPTGGPSLPAVFRTLDAAASVKMQTEFWKEIDKISDYHHPNITAVLGINRSSQPSFVAFEASAYGNLSEYLKSNSEIIKCQPVETCALMRASILPHAVLVSIAVQVASALEFLHSKSFVHSELNSSNVLVCENGVVKISLVVPGSGLNYFVTTQGKSILLRWSPPEVVGSLAFSEKGDVWSFGVLLWEIYSCSSIPYSASSDIEVVDMIKSVRLLSCPSQCPADMYAMMVRCWHKSPSGRPTAAEMHDQLRLSWTELNRAPSAHPSLGSDQSQGIVNPAVHPGCDNQQPLLRQVALHSSSNQQLTPSRLLASHSSSTSQKSSPTSSSVNYKPVNVCTDFGSSLGKTLYLGGEMYNEQIV